MNKAMSAAERQKKSREKSKELGEREIRFKMSQAEYELAEKMGKLRAGCREPYTPSDYVAALFRLVLPLDEEKYHTQANALGMCDTCNSVLPAGCGGAFKGQNGCYHTSDYKALEVSPSPKINHHSLNGAILEQDEYEVISKLIGRIGKFYQK